MSALIERFAIVAAGLIFGAAALGSSQPARAAVNEQVQLAEIQKSLGALGLKIERLQGRNQVEKVQRAYGYYVDKAQWPGIADMFTQDGTYEIGGRGVFIGPKRVLEYLVTGLGPIGMGSRYNQMIDHQQFQGVVNVSADGKRAWGRWTAFVMSSGGWGDCIYENEYVKEDGVWKIKHLRGPFMMYSAFKGGWRDTAVTNTWPDKFPPPPDLQPTVIYLTYPSFYVPTYHYPNPVTGKPMPAPNPAAGGVQPMKPVTN
jgi:SnoaL-like domain